MGLRVRAVLVVLLLLAIAALAFPLALSLADRRTAALAAERDRQLAALADAAAVSDAPLQRLVDRYFEVYGEGLLITDSRRPNAGVARTGHHRTRRREGGQSRPCRRASIAVDPHLAMGPTPSSGC